MNIWEILGIEPTRDQGAVRRAYAAAAARYNPEEHPEEFLAVRQAYEQALAFARSAEEPVEVPELPELTMPAQPLPAMEPGSRTAATGGFTLELEPESEYEVFIGGTSAGRMTTNLSGKLSVSVELSADQSVDVRVSKC